MSRPLKAVPKFVPGKKESEHDFMRRVERETQSVITRHKLEDKYKTLQAEYDKSEAKADDVKERIDAVEDVFYELIVDFSIKCKYPRQRLEVFTDKRRFRC